MTKWPMQASDYTWDGSDEKTSMLQHIDDLEDEKAELLNTLIALRFCYFIGSDAERRAAANKADALIDKLTEDD